MKPQAMPVLSPLGTARQTMSAAPALFAGLAELQQTSDLDAGDVFLAWQLAALARGLARFDRDALALLIGRLLVAEAAGSTRLALGDGDRALLARAPELVGGTVARTPLVLDGSFLYTERAHACEERVAAHLAARLASGPFSPLDLERAVDEAAALGAPVPSDEQKAAVVAALGRRLGVISGGPGTGKTTTALLLVRSLARLGVPPARIALAAPTGKAKSRLEEDFRARLGALADPPRADRELLALCPPAQTLHRLLGAAHRPGIVPRAARDSLPFRAVIVDESSMIDLVLMDRLLDALPDGGQLVLLGDADQLPSVSAGAVFRDLAGVASRLARGFRTDPSQLAGSQLVALANAVRAGEADAAVALCTPRGGVDEVCREGAELLSPEHRDELLRRHHARRFPAAFVALAVEHVFSLRGDFFDGEDAARLDALAPNLGAARVLAVTRQGPGGALRANDFLHGLRGGGPFFLPGEPVLMLRNDYQRELWNGDQGFAVRVRRPGQPDATATAFRTRKGWLAVDPRTLGSAHSLGYALTVHKAQGSEYDEVVLLLPDHACPIFTRELLYTAISRARRSVVVCGSLDIFKSGVATREERSSGVEARLASASRARALGGPSSSPPWK